MRNDYKRTTFWEKRVDEQIVEYFFKYHNEYIPLNKEVYMVLKNSYRKLLREQIKDHQNINQEFDVETRAVSTYISQNLIDSLLQKEIQHVLMKMIAKLPMQECYTIIAIFYDDKTETEVAQELHITKSSVHRRKVAALKKLKKLLVMPNQNDK